MYAMELRDARIRVWMFPRDKIPLNISNSSSSPDPSGRGEALADFPSTHTATSARISRIKVSSQLLTFVATSLVPPHTTQISTTVQVVALNLRQKTEQTSRTLTVSSIASGYTRRSRFHIIGTIYSIRELVDITLESGSDIKLNIQRPHNT